MTGAEQWIWMDKICKNGQSGITKERIKSRVAFQA
jgi:hypothetical protein